MKNLDQWILRKGGKPVSSRGYVVDPHDPKNWMSYVDACDKAATLGMDVGFTLTSADPYWMIDIDHCVVDGQWSPLAMQVQEAFAGACIEVSRNGEGLHIYGVGEIPSHSCKNTDLQIEYYHEGRFASVNSDLTHGNYDLDCSTQVKWLVDSYFPPRDGQGIEWRNMPVPEWNGIKDDVKLIEKMCKSKSAKNIFGNKASFKDLWTNDVSVLGESYPSINPKDPYDRSSADMAMASHLAFWTGKNHERIRTLMLQSGLVRDKWTSHKNYLSELTITIAVNGCRNVHGCQKKEQAPISKTNSDPVAWTADYIITDDEIELISDPEWIIENLVIKGHVIAFPAKPNAGKTTIFFHLAGEMVDKGYEVVYVNADVSGGDAKKFHYAAKKMGVTLLLPDMKVGKSMSNVVDDLQTLNSESANLDGLVFIFDTLKKMADVISKQKSANLYKLFRSLSAKGMTIILLSHTNKYDDEEGNPVFEGTGDLRADVDELIYLVPMKNPDGSLTVSTKPDKVRGDFKPITFDISKDREVTQRNQFVDTHSSQKLSGKIEKDQEVIDLVNKAIEDGYTTQKSIVDLVKNDSSYGVRVIRRVLSDYSKTIEKRDDVVVLADQGLFWGKRHGERNSHIYENLVIVPEGEDRSLYLARIIFGSENSQQVESQPFTAP